MATLFNDHSAQGAGYAKRMSTHLAAALVTFCLLQIVIVARTGGSLVLHLGIIVAIGAYAIFARGLERRWEMLDHSSLSRHGLSVRFRRDAVQVWAVSVVSGLLWLPIAIIFRFLIG